jgi:hypothetical protein
MLIINNGVPKSGSTWVQRILSTGLQPAFPSESWRNDWVNPSVDNDRLRGFMSSGETDGPVPVLLKMHFAYNKMHSYLLRDEVKVVVTYRNLPDSVLSWFHHQGRTGKTTPDKLNSWCMTAGRSFALRAISHRLSWLSIPNLIALRYEDLVANPVAEIGYLFESLGFEKPYDECSKIAQATQVKIPEGAPLREGMHVRTAGRSLAHEELPQGIYDELRNIDEIIPDLRKFQAVVPPMALFAE